MFNVFKMDKKDIKLVILGQDPYPNKNANGIAFSSEVMTESLRVLTDALALSNTCDFNIGIDGNFDTTLKHWQNNGIFLLNCALSLEIDSKQGHYKMWKPFIKEVLEEISEKGNVAFLLLGRIARTYRKFIKEDNNLIVETIHPASVRFGNFFNCEVFNKITEFNNEIRF